MLCDYLSLKAAYIYHLPLKLSALDGCMMTIKIVTMYIYVPLYVGITMYSSRVAETG